MLQVTEEDSPMSCWAVLFRIERLFRAIETVVAQRSCCLAASVNAGAAVVEEPGVQRFVSRPTQTQQPLFCAGRPRLQLLLAALSLSHRLIPLCALAATIPTHGRGACVCRCIAFIASTAEAGSSRLSGSRRLATPKLFKMRRAQCPIASEPRFGIATGLWLGLNPCSPAEDHG